MLVQIILFLRYMLAEGLGLSGIVSILFTGMVIASFFNFIGHFMCFKAFLCLLLCSF